MIKRHSDGEDGHHEAASAFALRIRSPDTTASSTSPAEAVADRRSLCLTPKENPPRHTSSLQRASVVEQIGSDPVQLYGGQSGRLEGPARCPDPLIDRAAASTPAERTSPSPKRALCLMSLDADFARHQSSSRTRCRLEAPLTCWRNDSFLMLLDWWSRPLMQIEQTGLVSNLAPVHAGALLAAPRRMGNGPTTKVALERSRTIER